MKMLMLLFLVGVPRVLGEVNHQHFQMRRFVSCFICNGNGKSFYMQWQGFHSQNLCAIFTKQNAKFFFLCASVLREKTTIYAIICKSHFAQNCPIPLLRTSSFAQFCNYSFAQFRNFVKIKRLVTVCLLYQNPKQIVQ